MAINNKPTIQPVIVTGIFTRYIAKTLPLAFDESMSYYECLCAMLEYLNETIVPDINNVNNGLSELQTFYEQLQEYVNTYFDNLDVQTEINNKLDELVEDGTLTELISNYLDPIINNFMNNVNLEIENIDNKVNSAVSGSPLVATSTSEMVDTDRIYVNTTDGKWYYYNGSVWTIGGTYQSTELANNSITSKKLKNNILQYQNMGYLLEKYNINSLNRNIITTNTGLSGDAGTVIVSQGDKRLSTLSYLQFTKNPVFKLTDKAKNIGIDYYVNIYEQIEKQENSYDFTTLNLERGSISRQTGLDGASNYYLRTNDYITVDNDTYFEPDIHSYRTWVYQYDSNNEYITNTEIAGDIENVVLSPDYKYRCVFAIVSVPDGSGIPDNMLNTYINFIKQSILTRYIGQIEPTTWFNYNLSYDNTLNKLFKIVSKKHNNSNFDMTNDNISDYILISDDLTTPLQNKKISILGDSFSAYDGDIPSGNTPYYYGDNAGVDNKYKMWYYQLINNNGAIKDTIQANSGSNVSYIRNQEKALSNTNMCENLGNPDIIIIMGGTNDFSHTPALLGDFNGSTEFPSTNTNFSDAYALMLSRIVSTYPNATVFCCGIPLFVRTNLNKAQCEVNTETNGEHKTIYDYSEKIRQIATIMNCQYIDLNECGFNRENYYDTYCEDNSSNSTHPNAKGQEVLYKVIEKKVIDIMNNLK